MRTDVLISKVNNRLQASLWTLKSNRYITINGRKKLLGAREQFLGPGPEFLSTALFFGTITMNSNHQLQNCTIIV